MLGTWSFVSHDDSALGAAFVSTLARALSVRGKRVLLIDLCPTMPALDIAQDVAHRVIYTLSDASRLSPAEVFLSPDRRTEKATEREERILLVPISVREQPCEDDVRACIAAASADAVLICAERSTIPLARRVSDGMILLTHADAHSLRGAVSIVCDADFDGFVLTDFLPVGNQIEREPSLLQLSDMLSLPLVGILPRGELKNSLSPREKDFRIAVVNMAGRLMGERVPLLEDISIAGMKKTVYFERFYDKF